MSSSGSSPSKGRSKSRERQEKHKMFVTNLDGTAIETDLKKDLTERFEKYGALHDVTVKKSKNGEYCFAFVEYQKGENGEEAVQKLNGTELNGKHMKVELQDDTKRRKDSDIGCYTCGKKGHFARECRSGRDGRRDGGRGYRDRSPSSEREDRHRKHKHQRRSSDSSERSRSRTKQKKDKSKKRKEHKSDRKEKKSKKSRRRSSSRSES